MIEGVIHEVQNGIVYGTLFEGARALEFEVPVLDVLEDQRVELEPNRYVSLVNGHLLIEKTIWTTHECEQADLEARQMARYFRGIAGA